MLESIIVSLALALTFFGVPEVTLGGFVAGVAGQGSIGALCAYKSDEVGPLQGALNFAVTNTVGAVLIVLGLALEYGRTGALNFAHIQAALSAQHDPLVVVAFWLIACGFLVKAAVFPFHFWLGDAHAVAPTPVSVMFSGVMVTAGVYAVARVWFGAFAPALAVDAGDVRAILLTVGACTAIVGSMMCWSQRHLKRLLAFSTVAHVGVIVLGLGLLTPRGLAGACVYAIGHGLDKGALFMLAGSLLHCQRSIDEIALRGRGKRRTGVVWALAALGLAGVPPFGTFDGDDSIGHAAREVHADWIVWLTGFVAVVTAASVLRAGGRVFLGWGPPEPEVPGTRAIHEEPETHGPTNLPPSMTAAAAALVALSAAVGLVPHFGEAALAAAARFVDSSGYAATVMASSHGPFPVAAPAALPHEFAKPAIAIVVAAAIAAAALFRRHLPDRLRRSARRIAGAAYAVPHRLHSGHVGDYVTWLVLGAAAITGVASLAAH